MPNKPDPKNKPDKNERPAQQPKDGNSAQKGLTQEDLRKILQDQKQK